MGSFNTVDFRHHVIHENKIVFLLLNLVDCVLGTCCRVNLHVKRLEETFGNSKVDCIVVYDKNLCFRSCEREVISFKVSKGSIVVSYSKYGVERKYVDRFSDCPDIDNIESLETLSVFNYNTLKFRVVCNEFLDFL